MIYVCLADGFEEMEAIAPIDILRRAELPVQTVGITGPFIRGAHGIVVEADLMADQMEFSKMEALVLPGGMPGTLHLEQSKEVQGAIDAAVKQECYLCAICAAPSILGHKHLLEGRRAVCFPGYEQELYGARLSGDLVVTDGKLITAKGAGAALEFGLQIVAEMAGKEKSEKIRASLQCIR